MATSTGRTRCFVCGKEKAGFKCAGCLNDFCFGHLNDHRQQLFAQLDDIEVSRDLFRQTLSEQIGDPQKHPLVKQIDEWEHVSINKIRTTAKEAKQMLFKHINGFNSELEEKLNKLTNQLRESRQENDIIETDLIHWEKELTQLTEQLITPTNITIQDDSTSLVNNIHINISSIQSHIPNIRANTKWMQNGITVAGGNKEGNGSNQFNLPDGLYVDDDQTIYVADYNNHRIVEWKNGATSGQVIAGGREAGNRNDQLNGPTNVFVDKQSDSLIISDSSNGRVMRWPRRNGTHGEVIISNIACWGLSMDDDGYLYVSDYGKHEVRRWKIGDTNGIVVAGGNGAGNRLDQLNRPTYIYVDEDHSVYVSDTNNHRVTKWREGAKEGIIVAGGNGQGAAVTQLSDPYGLVVDQLGTVYVADYSNHRVVRWLKGATQGATIIGGNGYVEQPNQLNHPIDLSFDQQGNLYVADDHNHRIQKFNIEPNANMQLLENSFQ